MTKGRINSKLDNHKLNNIKVLNIFHNQEHSDEPGNEINGPKARLEKYPFVQKYQDKGQSRNYTTSLPNEQENIVGGLSNKAIVIIVAYMRTGSSLTGSIFQEYPGTTFKVDEKHPVFMEEIKNWLTCDLESISIASLSEAFHMYNTKVMRSFYNCAKEDLKKLVSFRNGKSTGDAAGVVTKRCLNRAIVRCNAAPLLAFKFIRLRMGEARMLIPYFPNLKIVHLVRDPRAIFNSRKSVGLGKSKIDVSSVDPVKEFCSLVEEDIIQSKLILRTEPARVHLLMYEDLAENPIQTAEKLFQFANLAFSVKIKNYMIHKTSSKRDSCKFCTERKNSTVTSMKWRSTIRYSDAYHIYRTCKNSMDAFGYLPLSDLSQLRNRDISSRLKHGVYPL
ncbi:CHST3-like protein [Mya arenaria]|uniref:CHST3-like protein n=1 Tax=Mya arenaria TaxID=6604 RepID=A0ABY7EIE7_MYAAR|nr:CHST3-like protein [Mya arenaria]